MRSHLLPRQASLAITRGTRDTTAAIADPFSRVPLFWESLRTDKPSENEFEPGTFHRFARKRSQFHVIPWVNATTSANRWQNVIIKIFPKLDPAFLTCISAPVKFQRPSLSRETAHICRKMNERSNMEIHTELSNETRFCEICVSSSARRFPFSSGAPPRRQTKLKRFRCCFLWRWKDKQTPTVRCENEIK